MCRQTIVLDAKYINITELVRSLKKNRRQNQSQIYQNELYQQFDQDADQDAEQQSYQEPDQDAIVEDIEQPVRPIEPVRQQIIRQRNYCDDCDDDSRQCLNNIVLSFFAVILIYAIFLK